MEPSRLGVGSHFFLHRIFPTQGSNPGFLCLLHWQTGSLPPYHLNILVPNLLSKSLPRTGTGHSGIYKKECVIIMGPILQAKGDVNPTFDYQLPSQHSHGWRDLAKSEQSRQLQCLQGIHFSSLPHQGWHEALLMYWGWIEWDLEASRHSAPSVGMWESLLWEICEELRSVGVVPWASHRRMLGQFSLPVRLLLTKETLVQAQVASWLLSSLLSPLESSWYVGWIRAAKSCVFFISLLFLLAASIKSQILLSTEKKNAQHENCELFYLGLIEDSLAWETAF